MHKRWSLAIALASILFAASGVVTAQTAGAAPGTARVIEVTAKKYEFSPAEIRVKKGENVEFRIHSVDETHGMKIDVYAEGVKHKGAPGSFSESRKERQGRKERGPGARISGSRARNI